MESGGEWTGALMRDDESGRKEGGLRRAIYSCLAGRQAPHTYARAAGLGQRVPAAVKPPKGKREAGSGKRQAAGRGWKRGTLRLPRAARVRRRRSCSRDCLGQPRDAAGVGRQRTRRSWPESHAGPSRACATPWRPREATRHHPPWQHIPQVGGSADTRTRSRVKAPGSKHQSQSTRAVLDEWQVLICVSWLPGFRVYMGPAHRPSRTHPASNECGYRKAIARISHVRSHFPRPGLSWRLPGAVRLPVCPPRPLR